MFIVGLTGGVGSGKSTVAGFLTHHDVFLIDADQVAREVVGLKSAGLAAIRERFGPSVLSDNGELDRGALADLVFSDETALSDLNSIVHPLVRAEIARRLEKLSEDEPDAMVLLMVPLLIESGVYPTDVIVVIDIDPAVAAHRLVHDRGWTEAQVLSRMRVQLSRRERNAKADYVIDNNGSIDALRRSADEAWQWLVQRAKGSRGTSE